MYLYAYLFLRSWQKYSDGNLDISINKIRHWVAAMAAPVVPVLLDALSPVACMASIPLEY